MVKNKNKYFDTELEIAALGVFAVIILESIALYKGINGIMFGSAMTCIGVIMGWVFKTYRVKTQK